VERDILGLSSLRPFEGERAENRCCDSLGATDEIDATEPVEDLRSPVSETESRLPLRCKKLPDDDDAVTGT
jgi:hypothetical protein